MRNRPGLLLVPTILLTAVTAACSSSASGGDPAGGGGSRAGTQHVSAPPRPARLVVDVTLSGGPLRPDGTMALSDSPDVGDVVTVTARGGQKWTAPVGHDGDARFTLPPGQYEITAANCPDLHRVELSPNGLARIGLHCDVP